MRSSHPLLVGLILLGLLAPLGAVLLWPRHTDTPARSPWLGPRGTVWAGVEARGMQRWGGYFSNVGIAGEYFELRCRRRPSLSTRSGDYWPGPEWDGYVQWHAAKVVYTPTQGRPKRKPVSIAAPDWLQRCPAN